MALVQGFVALANVPGHINFPRSATSGRGNFSMIFDHYEEVLASMVEKLMEKEAKTDTGLRASAPKKSPGAIPGFFCP